MDVELARMGRERAVLLSQLETCGRASGAAESTAVQLRDATAILVELRERLPTAPFAVRRALVERLIRPGGVVFAGEDLRITMLVPRAPATVEHSASITHHDTHLKVRVVA